jgi:phage-related protein
MKTLHWIGPSLSDLRRLPLDAQDKIGHALYLAQMGGQHAEARPQKGFKGAHVPDVIEDRNGTTVCAAYLISLSKQVYVLHAVSLKPKRGGAFPEVDSELIRRRLGDAVADTMRR